MTETAPMTPLACPETGLPITPIMAIRPEMIDYNGHLNIAGYVKLFDEGIDLVFEPVGLAQAYVTEQKKGFFALELHVRYLRELLLRDPVKVRLRLLDVDDKRIHYWMEMLNAETGGLSATMEILSIHMDMAARKPAPFSPEVRALFDRWLARSAGLPAPEGVRSTIGIRRKA